MLGEKTSERFIKVVHVHFLHGHKNYYFGGIRAIFRKFSERELGVTEDYLRHQLSHNGATYINDMVLVVRSCLITSKRGG